MGLITASRDKTSSSLVGISLGIVSVCVVTILFWQGYAALVNYAYPVAALLVGLWLYSTRTPLYLGFTWWIWFLTPFVRRLVDYHVGFFNPMSPVMLAPYIVSGVGILTIVNAAGQLTRRRHLPFLLALVGVVYGYVIGLAKVGPMSATFALLDWMFPVILALHVFLLPNLAEEHKEVAISTFTWGVLIMGLYGLLQYTNIPPWDAKWLLDSGMWKTMGLPEDGQFRIFSTLNSTGPFAFVMTGGLLLLFASRNVLSAFAAVPGYFSFLLSLVRAAWGGWFVGLAYLAWRSTGTFRKRVALLLAITVLLSVPLYMYAPNTQRATDRAETLTNLEEDTSFRARLELHILAVSWLATTPVGEGIGNYGTAAKLSRGEVRSFDSGVFSVLLTLGWIGSILYVGAVLWLLVRLFRGEGQINDPFVTTLAAITFSFMAMMLFINQLNGVTGTIVWPILGLALATIRNARLSPTHVEAV